jgi:hypothetical protein
MPRTPDRRIPNLLQLLSSRFESHGKNSKVEYTYGWYSESGGKNMICRPYYQGKAITRLYAEKQINIDSLILKHPNY